MDKPYRTIAWQIERLEQRGLEIDVDPYGALERIGYYTLINGYKQIFIDVDGDPDLFVPATRLSHLLSLRDFDVALSAALFPVCLQAEGALKTVASNYTESQSGGSLEPYLDPATYERGRSYKKLVNETIKVFRHVCDGKFPYDRQDCIRHYRATKDRLPFWVVATVVNFGDMIRFVRCANPKIRNGIGRVFADLFEQEYGQRRQMLFDNGDRTLLASFTRIKDARNACAHGDRLYCLRVGKERNHGLLTVVDDLYLVTPQAGFARLNSQLERAFDDLQARIPGYAFERLMRLISKAS